jgi:Ca-activated chloride channel family protein
MSGYGFEYPWALAGFAVFIPLVLLDIFSPRGIRIRKLLSGPLRARLLVSKFFFRVFLACCIIALAGPRWGVDQSAGEYRRFLDTVIAVDVSRSMEIQDAPSFDDRGGELSRLQRGIAIARETAAAVPDARFAVAISRSRGIVTVPLTWDNGAVLNFLEALDGSSLTGRGTNLESLVNAAASAFQSSFPSRRLILLVSDGEALSGSLKAAVDRCARENIAVAALALGSEEGRPVPTDEELISRRDTAAMRMAAERGGGVYIDGSRADAAGALAAYLRSLAVESESRGRRREPKPRWFIFTLLALAAFGASKVSLLQRRSET